MFEDTFFFKCFNKRSFSSYSLKELEVKKILLIEIHLDIKLNAKVMSFFVV